MNEQASASLDTRPRGWAGALILIGVVTALRLAYVLWLCPYALIEDEAYYRLWALHLDWSYMTKGPGVALTVAAGMAVAGDTQAGVRLSAPLWGGLLALCVAGIAGELAPPGASGRARVWGASAALLSAPMQAAALLMLIDGPVLACWAGAVWGAIRAIHRAGTWSWVMLGTAIGVGVLFKPIILVVGLGVLGHALASGRTRRLAPGWGRWAACGVVAAWLGLVPMLAWNAVHGWAMVEHLGAHMRPEGDGAGVSLGKRVGWVGEYIGLQAGLGGIGLAVGILGARTLLKGPMRGSVLLCVWTSAAAYAIYLVVSAFTRVEGNWALGGLIAWLGVGGAWLGQAVGRGWATHLARAMVVIGLVTGVGMARLDLVARAPVVGRLIPVGRLTSAPAIAAGIRAELGRREGGSSGAMFVATDHYGSASLLRFYLRERRVVCTSGSTGRAITQFDLWDDTRSDDPALFGRAALILGGRRTDWERLFDRVEEIGPIEGDHRARPCYIGHAYLGGLRAQTHAPHGDPEDGP